MNTILKTAEVNEIKVILFIGPGYHKRWGTTQNLRYDVTWCKIGKNKIVQNTRPRLPYTKAQIKFKRMVKAAIKTKFEKV